MRAEPRRPDRVPSGRAHRAAPRNSDSRIARRAASATIINDADSDCRLDWSLVAAIGYVESDHGRDSGSRLDEDGVARPEIRGARLDGTRDTQRVKDTDAGLYDGDQRFDRAVGPMQILPSTWSLIGVDADGDDVRDPHHPAHEHAAHEHTAHEHPTHDHAADDHAAEPLRFDNTHRSDDCRPILTQVTGCDAGADGSDLTGPDVSAV